MPTTPERYNGKSGNLLGAIIDESVETARLFTDTAKAGIAIVGLAAVIAASYISFEAGPGHGASTEPAAGLDEMPEGIISEGTTEWAASEAAKAAEEIIDADGNTVYVITDLE